MLKLIAILVLSGQLQVAVEQPSGYAESTFDNSEAGAQALIEFAEESVGDAPAGVRVVVGWLNDSDNDEHIIAALADLGIKHGLATPEDITKAALELQLAEPNARAVVVADEKRFGFLYRKKGRN
jgi:hypothetical protein